MVPTALKDQFYTGDEQPLVSISCIAFNHSNYIREAIEGFLIQKTTFPVEILIHDDASIDGTQIIIKEYENKYPKIILPIYQFKNQHSRGGKISLKYNWPRARGKYIALCEGDDYWTDPLKLQKQVDFLEENPEYVLSHTECDIYFESSKKFNRKVNGYTADLLAKKSSDQIFYDLINSDLLIRTASVVFRAKYISITANDTKFKMGDTPLWLRLSQIGKFHYLDEPTVVYRVTGNSATQPGSNLKRLEFVYSSYQMRYYYLQQYNFPIGKRFLKLYIDSFLNLVAIDSNYYKNSNDFNFFQMTMKQKIKFAMFGFPRVKNSFRKLMIKPFQK